MRSNNLKIEEMLAVIAGTGLSLAPHFTPRGYRRPRIQTLPPPRAEIAAWNAEVDRKRAEKKARKAGATPSTQAQEGAAAP